MSAVEAAIDADVVLHLTEWREFRELHPATLSGDVRQRRIVDGRNTLDRDLWTEEGWLPGRSAAAAPDQLQRGASLPAYPCLPA